MTGTLSYDSAKSLFSGHLLEIIRSVMAENVADMSTAQNTIKSEIERLDSYLSRFQGKVPAFHKKAVKLGTEKRDFLTSLAQNFSLFEPASNESEEDSKKADFTPQEFLYIPKQSFLTDTLEQEPLKHDEPTGKNHQENTEVEPQKIESDMPLNSSAETKKSTNQSEYDIDAPYYIESEEGNSENINDQSEQIKEIYEQTRIDHIAYLLDKFSEYHAQGKGLAHQDGAGNDYQLFYRPKEDEPFKFYHYKDGEIEKYLSFPKTRLAINYFADLIPSFGFRPDLPENIEDCANKYFFYKATARPIGLGTTPRDYVRFENTGGFGSVVFDRPLTKEELNHFDLRPLRYADKDEDQKEDGFTSNKESQTSEDIEASISEEKAIENEKISDNTVQNFNFDPLNEIPKKLESGFEIFKKTTAIQKSPEELMEFYKNTVLPSCLKTTQDQLEKNLQENHDTPMLHIGNIGEIEKLKAKQQSDNRENVTYLYYNIWGEDTKGDTYHFKQIGPYKYTTNPTSLVSPEEVKSRSKKNRMEAKEEKNRTLWALEEIKKKHKPTTKQSKTSKQSKDNDAIEEICKKEFGSHLVSGTVENYINEGLSKEDAIDKTKRAINEIVQNGIPEKHIESIKNADKIKKKQEVEKLTSQKGKSIYYYIIAEDSDKNQTYLFKTEPYHFLTSNLDEQKDARGKATETANLWLVACRILNSQKDLETSNTKENHKFLGQEQNHNENQHNDFASLT